MHRKRLSACQPRGPALMSRRSNLEQFFNRWPGSRCCCCVSCAFMQPSRMWTTEGGAVHFRRIRCVAVAINIDEGAGGKQQPEGRGDLTEGLVLDRRCTTSCMYQYRDHKQSQMFPRWTLKTFERLFSVWQHKVKPRQKIMG